MDKDKIQEVGNNSYWLFCEIVIATSDLKLDSN